MVAPAYVRRRTSTCLATVRSQLARGGRLPSFFEGIAKTGSVTELTPLSFTSDNDGHVHVFLRYAFTVTANGKDVAMNLHHHWRFRNGKVAYYCGAEDTALVASALGA